jgi:hypothetical protein
MSEPQHPSEIKNNAADEESRPSPALLSPEDFYMENGLMVFTAAYHLKRGYCCNSGCRHCPFQ